MTIRELRADDGPAMLAFAGGLPAGEATFFKDEQVRTDRVVDWATHPNAVRLVAEEEGAILGYAGVLPGAGLSAHVGEVRMIVASFARRRGVGRALARRAMLGAFAERGLEKLFVEVVADDEGTIALFKRLGFVVEALLRDHLRDRNGRLRDLVLLAHLVDEGWSDMATLGLASAR